MICSTSWLRRQSVATSLLMIALLASQAAGQVQRETLEVAPYELVVLTIQKQTPAAGGGPQATSVVWAMNDPVDGRFEAFETAEAFKVAFVGPAPNGRVLMEATEINWDARTFSKKVWRVLAKGATPTPPGPGPGPDPTPPPDPTPGPQPGPVTVPEGFLGLTRTTYGMAQYYKPAKASAAKAAATLEEVVKEKRGTLAAHFQAGNKAMKPLTDADAGLKAVMAGVEAITDKQWADGSLRSADNAVQALRAVADGLKRYGEDANASKLREPLRLVTDARARTEPAR